MTPHENKAILVSVFAETAKGNGRPFIEALADDVRWTIIGATPWSKTYAGKAAVINDLLRPLGRQLGGASIIKAHNIVAEGDQAVVEATGHNTTVTGNRYENTYCWVIRMGEGKIRALTEYADTQLIASALEDPRMPG